MTQRKPSIKEFKENLSFSNSSSLGRPFHKPSLVGRVGQQARSLLGPRSLFLGLVLAWLSFGGARYLLGLQGRQTATTASSSGTASAQIPAQIPAQSVTLHTAQLETVEKSLVLTGTVMPRELLRVTPAVSGLPVIEMRVEAGDRVQSGQILAVLDDSILRANLAQAEANLAQAQAEISRQEASLAQADILQQAAIADISRYSTLYNQGAVSQEQLGTRQVDAATARENVFVVKANLDSAQANIASKLAEISSIQAQLVQTVVVAPAAGTIAERFTTVGDTASAGTPLYSLIENGQLDLVVNPSQLQLEQIQVGESVTVSPAIAQHSAQKVAQKTATFEGRVRSIDPTLDAQSREATVKISIQGSSTLRAGMFLQATIATGRRRSVVVPAAAVIAQADGRDVVYTLAGDREASANKAVNKAVNKVQINPVEVATPVEESPLATGEQPMVEIISGISAGSQVIVGGASYLQAGDAVEVVPADSLNPSPQPSPLGRGR